MRSRLLLLLIGAIVPGAAAAHPVALSGDWGSPGMVATFTETGARLRADCAEGSIAGPVHADRSGRFSGRGAYELFHGGPQRADEDVVAPAARFTGQIRGDTLNLTIRTSGQAAPLRFVLKRGVRPKLVRCL